ncbi:MAG: helix-hairpin-helix domain-containing protein [Bacteroidia bacterium]|nr:helix-hairpin-helix domain-containing protein [Bacteroidia bacterium]
MNLQQLRSQLAFNRGQRVGILLLIGLIVVLSSIDLLLPTTGETSLELNSDELERIQCKIDSIRSSIIERSQPKRYAFNPNFITDYKAYTLGMTPGEFDRLKSFRDRDQWINSVKDFQQVTGVSDSLLAEISPWFKFPEWVTNPKPRKRNFVNFDQPLSYANKQDLNQASLDDLVKVSGVGKVLGARIIELRSRLGGFHSPVQLNGVWGLKPVVIERIEKRFAVKTPKKIRAININTATASDLATIPGISFDLAKTIWEFVRLREGITELGELKKIEELTIQKYELIALYLSADP